jgi:hypothetical protein
MDHARIASEPQDHVHVQSKIDDFFGRFQFPTLMHRCGVYKNHGHSIRSLTEAIFMLPFVGGASPSEDILGNRRPQEFAVRSSNRCEWLCRPRSSKSADRQTSCRGNAKAAWPLRIMLKLLGYKKTAVKDKLE